MKRIIQITVAIISGLAASTSCCNNSGYGYEIKDDKKAIEDLINNYKKERLTNRKKEIIEDLSSAEISAEETKSLEKELHDIIIKLTRLK